MFALVTYVTEPFLRRGSMVFYPGFAWWLSRVDLTTIEIRYGIKITGILVFVRYFEMRGRHEVMTGTSRCEVLYE